MVAADVDGEAVRTLPVPRKPAKKVVRSYSRGTASGLQRRL